MAQEHDNVETGAAKAPEMGSAARAVDLEDNLLGDMRDRLLREVKRHFDWGKLPEAKQASFNASMEQVAREVIRDVAWITAGRTYPVIPVSVGGLKAIKDGMLEAKVTATGTEDTVLGLFHAGRCVLVLCDHQVFMGERAPAPVDKQQPDLMDPRETPEQRDAAEQTRLLGGFKPTDDAGTLGGAAAQVLGDLLPPAIKAAADRGRALRIEGGAFKVPDDLHGRPAEVAAFEKAWAAADRELGATTAVGEAAPTGEAPTEPAKAKRRGRRTVDQAVADRQAALADA